MLKHIVTSLPIKTREPIILHGGPIRMYNHKLLYNGNLLDNPYCHWYDTYIYPGRFAFHKYNTKNTGINLSWWLKNEQYHQLTVNPEINFKLIRFWVSGEKPIDCIDFLNLYHDKEFFKHDSNNFLEKVTESQLKSGDSVQFRCDNDVVHYAIFINNRLYLSKIGFKGPIAISNYDYLADLYNVNSLYRLNI